MVKNLPANAGNPGSIPGLRRSPGEGNGQPLQCPCLGNPLDKRSLVGFSPRSCKRIGHNLSTKQQVYDSATKRNIIESVEVMWINLETVIHSEVSQKEKNRYCILMYIFGI